MTRLLNKLHKLLNTTRAADFIAPLALRLYLAPIFWMAGSNKIAHMDATIQWFGNPDWGLGLPFPALMAWLAALSETGGAILLLTGLAVRWISIPLMITMIVAMATVHWHNGWLAIAEGGNSLFATDRTLGAMERLEKINEILHTYGNYDWLTQNGSVAILNNGIEFAATYLVMLLVLFFYGAGRYLSMDYWFNKWLTRAA